MSGHSRAECLWVVRLRDRRHGLEDAATLPVRDTVYMCVVRALIYSQPPCEMRRRYAVYISVYLTVRILQGGLRVDIQYTLRVGYTHIDTVACILQGGREGGVCISQRGLVSVCARRGASRADVRGRSHLKAAGEGQ